MTTTTADDPYPDNFPWPDSWSHEEPLLMQIACPVCRGNGCDADMEVVCPRCGGDGVQFTEAPACCEDGWRPMATLSGDEIALTCPVHGV